jgi:hypothetical protein
MALYRTLIECEQLGGVELLREYKPHKRVINFCGKNYYLPMPYVLFYITYDPMGEMYSEDSLQFGHLCVAFAKKPIKSFRSRVYTPMFGNIYGSLSRDNQWEKQRKPHQEECEFWHVCESNHNNIKMPATVDHFWNSEFNEDGNAGWDALVSNYKSNPYTTMGKIYQQKTHPRNLNQYYDWWESLDRCEDVLKYESCSLSRFLKRLYYDCEYDFETGL